MLPRTLVLLLALLVLAPGAAAHISPFSQTTTFVAGPYTVFFEPRPVPAYANTNTTIAILVSNVTTGALVHDVEARFTVTSPDGSAETVVLRPDGRGYLLGSFRPPTRGNYLFDFELPSEGEEPHRGQTRLDVYTDLPLRIRAADATQDLTTNVSIPLVFETTNHQFVRSDPVEDLTLRLEHWTVDHTTRLGIEEVPMTRTETGLWKADYAFRAQGMYHAQFASVSGNFTYDDTPILHLDAFDPYVEEGARASVPAPSPFPVLLAVALLLARRR